MCCILSTWYDEIIHYLGEVPYAEGVRVVVCVTCDLEPNERDIVVVESGKAYHIIMPVRSVSRKHAILKIECFPSCGRGEVRRAIGSVV